MYINLFHWVWYLLGFIIAPRLTFMILITIHFRPIIPLPLLIVGWILMPICNALENKKSR